MSFMTYDEELTWLKANVENIARRHGRKPEEVCDALIDAVCNPPAPVQDAEALCACEEGAGF